MEAELREPKRGTVDGWAYGSKRLWQNGKCPDHINVILGTAAFNVALGAAAVTTASGARRQASTTATANPAGRASSPGPVSAPARPRHGGT